MRANSSEPFRSARADVAADRRAHDKNQTEKTPCLVSFFMALHPVPLSENESELISQAHWSNIPRLTAVPK